MPDGTKNVLGLWIEQTEGANFWLRVMNELKCRGISGILIAVVDGLKGFPEAINAVFPKPRCKPASSISLTFAEFLHLGRTASPSPRHLKVSTAPTTPPPAGSRWMPSPNGPWGSKYPAIAQSWRRNWHLVVLFSAFPEAVRRIIYTSNAIEALNSKLRPAVRARGRFPNDDDATKLLYLCLNRAAAEWKRPPREWSEAKTQLAIIFNERFVKS